MDSLLERLHEKIRIADVIDVIFVTLFLYWVLLWFKKTMSRSIIIGIAMLTAVYLAAETFEMYLTSLLFQGALAILAIALVVVFQEDLRRTFERIAEFGFFRKATGPLSETTHLDTLVEVAFTLAENRRGALIVLKGREDLSRHVQGGISISGDISTPLLHSIFDPHSPGHDGAVVIENDKIVRFSVHLPLSMNRKEIAGRGTRHTAALGVSECVDVLVIVVSEERGTVTLAEDGRFLEIDSAAELKNRIERFLAERFPTTEKNFQSRLFTKHLKTKLVALLLACLGWYHFALRAEGTVHRTFVVPIEYHNISKDAEIDDDTAIESRITFSGSERAFQFLAPSALKVSVDARLTAEGKDVFTITDENVRHPANLTIYRIEPRTVHIKLLRQ